VAQAIMSLDGYVAKQDNTIGPLFDWLQNGEVEIPRWRLRRPLEPAERGTLAADATNPRPRIILEALTDLDRPGARPWLELLHDEQLPLVLSTRASSKVVWSSIWTKRRDAVIEFDLPSDGRSGTDLSWTLFVDDPAPGDASVAHMRKRRTCSSMLTFGTHSASSRLDWLSNRTMSSTGVRTDPSIWNTTIDIKTNTESVLCAVS
jgi:hypothetical protein